MKQKIICGVFLTAVLYLPVSSRECGKISLAPITEATAAIAVQHAAMQEEDTALPVSPAGWMLMNL